MLPFQLILLGLAHLGSSAQTPASPSDGSDLFSFVSRPDIRAPRFNVSIHRPDQLTPGYWFTAPYGDLRSRLPTTLYQPGQVGPHIYDNQGQLIWSGAHLFDDRPTFDFKVAEYNGAQHLTFITNEDLHEIDSPGGSAIILDHTYQRVKEIEDRAGRGTMNMHEYNTIEHGQRALTITFESKLADFTVDGETEKVFMGNNGFSEIDTETGEPVFSWWALDHVDPSESQVEKPNAPGSYSSPWDAYHINSVDKNAEGDYLVSARYTSAMYKVSGKDGHIIWRLGGSKSDFTLEGFNMSFQHDARFQSDNETAVVITFFNNHSDGRHATASTSAAVEVALDLSTMQAHVLQQWHRPDGALTKLRGNAQRLPNGHMFVCWSENSHVSEHTASGDLVMEAQMASHRLVSYRAYKMNFTAQPSEPIAVKAFVFGVDGASSTTVTYVSWNGATEVARWNFYGVGGRDQQQRYLGSADRTGFETTFMAAGAHAEVLVEALDARGAVLGTSELHGAELPSSWPVSADTADTGADGAPELDAASDKQGDDRASVSEDLSTRLHQAGPWGQTELPAADEHDAGTLRALLTSPLALTGAAAATVIAATLLAVRRARLGSATRLESGGYKALADDV